MFFFLIISGQNVAKIPRMMIREAVLRQFPAKTLRKLTVSSRNPPENARNPAQGSGDRIQLPVLTGSCWFRAEPDKSSHRNTASMKSPEICGSYAFLGGLFDLGCYNYRHKVDSVGSDPRVLSRSTYLGVIGKTFYMQFFLRKS